MKIVVLDGYLVSSGGQDWSPVSKLGEYVYHDMTTGADDVAARIGDADVILTNRCPISGETIEKCKNLKLIHSLGTGFNQIDLETANRRGITVTNTPGYGRGAVAQMTMALLFAITRRVDLFDRYVKCEGWREPVDPHICSVRQFELTGKTMGIIGLGDIGYAVARMALAMDMQVLAYSRRPKKELECPGLRYVPLEELLAKADVVSVHCPLNEETKGLINARRLGMMKPGAILLNTSRGAVLDEAAVVAALDDGRLYAAGVDVFAQEPPGKDHPLASHARCVATPHVAWMPWETLERVIAIAGENIKAFLDGRPVNVVNKPE